MSYARTGTLLAALLSASPSEAQVKPGDLITATKPNPRAALEYPFPRGYLPGFVMADIQLSHATRAALPGIGFPDEAGWYVNQGDTDDKWFSLPALIAGGR